MKKADIDIGGTYIAKVSGNRVAVQIDRVSPHGGWEATDLSTGRVVRNRTAARLRCLASRDVRPSTRR